MTAAGITKAVLPVMAGGAALRLVTAMSKGDDPALRDISLSLVASATAMSTLPPKSLQAFERLLGDANYGRFLSQCGTTTAAGFGTNVMLRSALGDRAEPRIRGHRRRLLFTLATMGALFTQDPSAVAELQAPSNRLFEPRTAAYWLLFAGYMVSTTGETAQLAAAATRTAKDGTLRSGLACIAAGTGGLGAFYVQLAAGTAARLATDRSPAPIRGVPAQAVIGSCAATVAFGATLPSAAWRIRALHRAGQDAVTWYRLRSVWRYLEAQNPEVTLPIGGLNRPDVRLFRRVVEILDSLDRLAAGRDPGGRIRQAVDAVVATRGLSDDDRVVLERAALLRYSQAAPASDTPPQAPGPLQPVPPRPGADVHSDYRQEARRLIAASIALRNSDHLELVMQLLDEGDLTDMSHLDESVSTQGNGSSSLPSGCTCSAPDAESLDYLEYAAGQQERARAEHEQDACSVHGASSA